MKKIILSIREFYHFKQICNFHFTYNLKKDSSVEVEADRILLENLGYN